MTLGGTSPSIFLMIVNDFYVMGIAVLPAKTKPPLVINSNAELALAFSF